MGVDQTKVLVTGANGFIGRALVAALQSSSYKVYAVTRRQQFAVQNSQLVKTVISDLDVDTDWLPHLSGVNAIVHCAARVHVMNDTEVDPLQAFRQVNTYATLNLAKQAAQAGVKRFVFISTIKVNGEQTWPSYPFREEVKSTPIDSYALSKWEAEQGLMQIAKETEMEVVIIRPPLVYGPGVKGNFATMIKWLKKGIPLPLGAIQNQRSLLALDNLVSFIVLCLKHPKAANQAFVLADGEDVSTTQLLNKIARAMDKPARLIPIPTSWMIFAAKLLGKRTVAERLFGSLQIDITKARQRLGWWPVVSMDEQLAKMMDD